MGDVALEPLTSIAMAELLLDIATVAQLFGNSSVDLEMVEVNAQLVVDATNVVLHRVGFDIMSDYNSPDGAIRVEKYKLVLNLIIVRMLEFLEFQEVVYIPLIFFQVDPLRIQIAQMPMYPLMEAIFLAPQVLLVFLPAFDNVDLAVHNLVVVGSLAMVQEDQVELNNEVIPQLMSIEVAKIVEEAYFVQVDAGEVDVEAVDIEAVDVEAVDVEVADVEESSVLSNNFQIVMQVATLVAVILSVPTVVANSSKKVDFYTLTFAREILKLQDFLIVLAVLHLQYAEIHFLDSFCLDYLALHSLQDFQAMAELILRISAHVGLITGMLQTFIFLLSYFLVMQLVFLLGQVAFAQFISSLPLSVGFFVLDLEIFMALENSFLVLES